MKTVHEDKLVKIGQADYVQNGMLHMGANAPTVMISAQSDLAELTDQYPPGTIAYTAGFKAMWQLGANGAWVAMA